VADLDPVVVGVGHDDVVLGVDGDSGRLGELKPDVKRGCSLARFENKNILFHFEKRCCLLSVAVNS
jgi:hypothetical protein